MARAYFSGAHLVIIKGTRVYDSSKGSFVDLSVLDVLQVFGRAGRPGFETSGEGYICTTEDKLEHYLNAVTSQVAHRAIISTCSQFITCADSHRVTVCASSCGKTVTDILLSRFVKGMVDAMNAEIALGTVTTVNDVVIWLGYTYLFVRMKKAPTLYGELSL
jgi:antiviral helicase SLH1